MKSPAPVAGSRPSVRMAAVSTTGRILAIVAAIVVIVGAAVGVWRTLGAWRFGSFPAISTRGWSSTSP